jgi:general secretion pathway protein A
MADDLNETDHTAPYISFYRLTKRPFEPTPDADCIFMSPSHTAALSSIRDGVRCRKGLMIVIGDAGVGKTTILRRYLNMVDETVQKTITIYNGSVSFDRLLVTILDTMSVSASGEPGELIHHLREAALAEHRRNRPVVVLIDEAHHLSSDTLSHLLMLCKLETENSPLLQIVLIGRPELETSLNRHELRPLYQQIAVRTKILPLTEKLSFAYIEYRLARAGSNALAMFSSHALSLIVKFAAGNPARLNIACSNALSLGCSRRHWVISRGLVKTVISNLNKQRTPIFSRGRKVATLLAIFAPALPLFIYMEPDSQVGRTGRTVGLSASSGTPAQERHGEEPNNRTESLPHNTAVTVAVMPDAQDEQHETTRDEIPLAPLTAAAEKAELAETARLLAVLLDSGRVVVGRAQPKINNPRLEDKGFSAAVFESQLRREFQTRAGYDLHDLAPAPMPDRAKPLLLRLARLMQKAVHDVQLDINKKGIGFKGFIPATFGTKVAEQFSKEAGLKLRQIGPPGIAPRNPDNKPDEQEEQALAAIQKSHPRAGDHIVEQPLADHGVRVLLPLFYTRQCLACHGKPKGEVDISGYEKEGFKEGDLGGAISVGIHADSSRPSSLMAPVNPELSR